MTFIFAGMFLYTDDLNARLNKFYYELDDIDSQIEEAEKRLASVQQQRINSDTIYKYLLYFDRYYDSFTDAEKKEFMQTFIEAIEIFEQKQDDGRFLKSITFKFPVYFNGGYVKQLGLTDKNTLETEDVSGIQYWIDIYAVEDECADNMYERSALDYLLYNEPVEYVNLLLSGKLRDYVQQNPIFWNIE